MTPANLQFERLNEAQRRAVEHHEGPLMVIAGPGSGKTRVMTHRIAHLIAGGAPADTILAITFTNKAAEEMRRRTERHLEQVFAASWDGEPAAAATLPYGGPQLSTFHSFCARLLRREIYHLEPYRTDFSIYDSDDQQGIVEEALQQLSLEKTVFPPRACLGFISSWKNHLTSPEEAQDEAESHRYRRLAHVYHAYQALLLERNALDFDDLLLLTLRVLRERPEVLDRRRRMHRYLLVDEFQDTNRPQYLIARLLCQEHGNLCITGDPDQSIYSWRGASPENFDRFREDFPRYQEVRLDQNYRSTPQIISVAQRLTGSATGPRELFTENPPGDDVRVLRVIDERAEARAIVDRIVAWQGAGSELREIAVLYRTNALSRSIEEEMVRGQVPYTVVGGTAFYQRKEVKDALCYLRAAAFPRDELALRRVINTPSRGIGKVGFERFEDAARDRGLSLGEALRDVDVIASLSGRSRKSFGEFYKVLEELQELRGAPLHRQIMDVVRITRYEEYLKRTEPENWQDRLQNIVELANAAAEHEELLHRVGGDAGERPEALVTFLERVALVTDVDRWQDRDNRVALMTLHSAKGLEFDRVAIAGVEQSLLPHSRSDSEGSVDEERRLLYVGITRGRRSVLLLHTAWRRRFREREPRLPSEFLGELEGEGVVCEEQAAWDAPPAASASYMAQDGLDGGLEHDPMRPGVWLYHDMFGRGQITGTSGFGNSRRITVRFEEFGEKQLVPSYAPLRIIDNPEGF